jgi:hypothetical protein
MASGSPAASATRGLVRLRPLIAAVAVLAACAPAAAAQDGGIFVDPDSPTGKEYEIPLESARRAATGEHSKPVQPGTRTAPLFGQGVGDDTATDGGSGDDSPPASTSGTGAGGSGGGGGGGGGTPGATPQAAPTAVSQRSARVEGSTGSSAGSGDVLVAGVIALAVLALGAAGGVLVRRRVRSA